MKNNGTTIVDEAEQTVHVFDDNETKEEENVKDDKVLEDSFDRVIENLTNMEVMLTNMTTMLKAMLQQ